MKLILEQNFDSKVIVEDTRNGKKDYFIEGVFMQSDTKNRNRRIYPRAIMEEQVRAYNDNFIKTGRAMGELGHPETPAIHLDRVSHKTIKLEYVNQTDVYGKAKLIDTPMGNIAISFVKEGIQLGTSSRGLGSLKESSGVNIVQNDFYLAANDIVADPSAPKAFVNGIMEGKEWVMQDGILVEQQLESIKQRINKAARRQRTDEEIVHIFNEILSA